ncbi:MAG: NAD(P)/FAD-dependent oxidoreductase [Planctomycetes bacterium]|nr:NAD(P)/FAD-dependent oxidoreductase [Planctomycetota bacterium]
MAQNRYDAIVIGAGMSGLAAGIRLAQFGKRVVVLEKHALWGGLNSFYKRGGRRYDTGLHALTNFVPKGTKSTPLAKLLRQLRISYDELNLHEQTWSRVCLGDITLRFANQFGLLAEDVAAAFPAEKDAFARLVDEVRTFDAFDAEAPVRSARAEIRRFLRDPLLIEALLVPICWYGSAREDDIDWDQFVILFRSLFLEGFARPAGGIKPFLDLLLARYRAEGGELRTRAGVERILFDAHSAARGVRLEDGTELESDCVLSSAGYPETMALAGRPTTEADVGRLSFVEIVHVLDRTSAALGNDATITFFTTQREFGWRRPETLVDTHTGVICCSDNYATHDPQRDGVLRITSLANYDLWCALDEAPYRAAKVAAESAILDAAAAFAFDPRPHRIASDMFTPRTLRHYTGHIGGTVYGSPHKRRDGRSGVKNLHLIGTDQGLLGIVGSMLSGVSMANRHALMETRANQLS